MTASRSRLVDAPLFDGDRPSASAIAAVMDHPHFPDAMRMLASGAVDLYRNNRSANTVMTDRTRFLISILAIHLHAATRSSDPLSGLTVSRIRQACTEHDLCSPGRAEAMIALMRVQGYLAAAPEAADRRLRRLVPTERLLAWHRERCAFTFAAAARVLPDGARAQAAIGSDAFVLAFLSSLAQTYLTGGLYQHYADYTPELQGFAGRNAGFVILFSLLLAGERDETFPPSSPVAVPLAALARNFAVSRSHVRGVLQEAIAADLLHRTGEKGEALQVTPRLANGVRRALAMYLVHSAHCARRALATIDQQRSTAHP
jgi:hypothetical protein